MIFKNISFKNFRNLNDSIIEFYKDNNIFKGFNGQGKTNILEALYIISFGSSFRTKSLKNCIKEGFDSFTLKSLVEVNSITHKIECFFSSNKRIIKIDDRVIRDRKELIYTIPCIIFTHDDLDIVVGEMDLKRRYFDQSISLYDEVYFDDILNYKNILKKRNEALKLKDYNILDIYDLKLAKLGFQIMKKRETSINESNLILSDLYKKISLTDDNVYLKYSKSFKNCNSEEDIIDYLKSKRENDKENFTTTVGIHRDRIKIMVNNDRDINTYGSTGQLRLISLILKLSQLKYYKRKTTLSPILLLDDVLLELDYKKRETFISLIEESSQNFYTFLPVEQYMNENINVKIFNIKEGIISENS